MQKFVIETVFTCYDKLEDLPGDEQALLKEAASAMNNAYAPYSHFKVGAAIQMANGVIQQGNNQENAAYPSGLCAERVAIFAAGAIYPGVHINKIAITAGSDHFSVDHPIAPCGACRQSILEYEINQKTPIIILLKGRIGKIYRIEGISPLLPLYFNEDGLKRH